MAKEIERKFLVRNADWQALSTSRTTIRQAYVASMDDRSVRVRIRNDRDAVLTIKIGVTARVRDEYEFAIPLADAKELLSSSPGTVIEKTRHTIDHDGFVFEVDVFEGTYRGLVVAEVEMADESDDPALPDWIGTEVTEDRRYSNHALAMNDLSREVCHGLQN